ncbi:mucin-2 [Triplophysa rosa]|uniref:Vascular associated protein n=1 Tax=Triplophysa rosa TaxID=992332 RepID=A0A9W7X085_TRIRA|nr:mucin-2 [Triplophysa rosa]KAI7811368.1 vascular associated protein [Triplophysa rosa]
MRRFVFLFLFIFSPGNALLKIIECGGKVNVCRDKSGSIRYPSHPDRSVFKQSTDNSSCTWMIDSCVNQTVWIEVISLGNGSLGIKFGNEVEQTYERDERALFSGSGRTIVQWRTVETSGALYLRWNTSDTSHDPALIPYTHSDANPVSPSPSGSNGVTYTPDIPQRTHIPKTNTPRGESVQQSRGVSDLADKSRPLFPQENTNNEQETAGKWISDLSLVGTNSYSDTHSGTDSNSASNTYEPFIARSSAVVHSSSLPLRTTLKQSSDVKTSTPSRLDTNTVTQHTEGSRRMDTEILSNTLGAKRGDPMFPTDSFLSVIPHVGHTNLFNTKPKQEFPTTKAEATTSMHPHKIVLPFSESIGTSQFDSEAPAITRENRPIRSETDRTDRLPAISHPNVNITHSYTAIYNDSITVSTTPVLSKFPDVNQSNPLVFLKSNTTNHSESLDSTSRMTEPQMNVSFLSTTENKPLTLSSTQSLFSTKHPLQRSQTVQPLTSSKESTVHTSHTIQSHDDTSTQQTSSASASISETEISDLTSHNNESSISFTSPTSPEMTLAGSSTPEGDTKPLPYESACRNLTCTPSTVQQDEGRLRNEESTTPPSIPSSGSVSPRMNPNVTSDLTVEHITTVRSESRTDLKELDISPSQVRNTNTRTNSPQTLSNTPSISVYTSTPQYWSPSPLENTQTNVDFSVMTHTNSPTQRSLTTNFKTTHGSDVHTGSIENTRSITTRTTASTLSPSSVDITSTQTSALSTPVSITTSSAVYPQTLTTKQSKMIPHPTSTENPSVQIHSHFPVTQPSTILPPKHTTKGVHVTRTNEHAISTHAVTQTSLIQSTPSTSDRKWTHGRRYFIVEDQPAIIKEETFQVLLQITLEENFHASVRLLEMEPFLQRVPGYQSQHFTWRNGPVLQTVVKFQTVKAVPWLGRAESLLQEAGLNPLPRLFVGGVRVKNITVGSLQTDVCDWLFECPSGFQCLFPKINASCTSVCHFDYCKHQGICVHRPDQQPLCQCPVGEDYWFMGQRCDLRMTRPRLVGVCFGVLIAVAAVMALLSYLAVRRFKSMLMQAKVEQTRSSYRRFNHFDELSARFWGRSWPGSEDSLDNPAFTRSDEILHLRALDRTCCYHDDTLSVVSTYHGSGTHLNTIYPHSSQYGWDLSNCSLADGVVDSGKASDLSVCSWPIEPIQWTPFPLLQQLDRNTTAGKVSRPRSYCEGMELVDLERSWTS